MTKILAAGCLGFVLTACAHNAQAASAKGSAHPRPAPTCKYVMDISARDPICLKVIAQNRKADATIAVLAEQGTAFTYTGKGWFCTGTPDAAQEILPLVLEHDYAGAARITAESNGTGLTRGLRLVTVGAIREKHPPHLVEMIQVSPQSGIDAGKHCWVMPIPFLLTPTNYNVAHIVPAD